jgi:hypothetical protein
VTRPRGSTIVLGAGPGGIGPLIYAAQNGLLDRWLDRGVTVIERRAAASSALSQYALFSDSFGASFLESTEVASPHPLLVRLRDSPEGVALRPLRDERPPLPIVGAFLARMEKELEATMLAHHRSRFLREREARTIHVADDHVTVECAHGAEPPELLQAETVVVALGGSQTMAHATSVRVGCLGGLGELAGERLRLSDRIHTEAGIADAVADLARAARPEVVIMGASHSAFSTAWLLAERAPKGMLGKGAITVVSRRAPRIFYRTLEAAESDGYRSFTARDVCPRTRRLHQLGGLRGDGRELWRRIAARPGTVPEPRVGLLDLANAGAVRSRIERATLIVAATGYRPRFPRILRDGRQLTLLAGRSSSSVDDACRVLTVDSTPLHRVFSLGMASGFVPSGTMGGEPSFRGHTNGVWLYQHGIGQRVYEGITEVLEQGGS